MAQPPPYSSPGYPQQPTNPPAYPGQSGEKAAYPPPGGAPPPQQPGYPPQQPGYPPQGYPPQGYPPQGGYQQPGYPAQPQQAAHHTTTTVIATQPGPVIVTGAAFGETPVSMTCPRCGAQIVTSTIYQDGSFAWLMAAILCFIACWPCCLIPFCLDGCKDVTHHCPNCRSHLGTYRRM